MFVCRDDAGRQPGGVDHSACEAHADYDEQRIEGKENQRKKWRSETPTAMLQTITDEYARAVLIG